jgi:hypothetical protein
VLGTALVGCGTADEATELQAGEQTTVVSATPIPSTAATSRIARYFDSPDAPIAQGEELASVSDAADLYRPGVDVIPKLGTPLRVVGTDAEVKVLYDSGAMTVQSTSVLFDSRATMERFAAQFADAPTPQHPTIVKVVDLPTAGVPALVLDPALESGTTPRIARSVSFVVDGQQYSLLLDVDRTETELLTLADAFASEAVKGER